jgi:O-antigen/teichoic acid export membrane protein
MLSGENLFAKMMLNNMLGADQLGIYSSIASPTLVVQVFASVAFNPFLPGLAELYTKKQYKHFLKGLRWVYLSLAVLSAVTCIGARIIGRWGLKLLFGADILAYYNLFMPIVWCTILTAFIWVLYSVLIAMRQIGLLVIGMAVDFIILLFITGPCIEAFEKNGASIAQIIVYALFIGFLVFACEYTVCAKRKQHTDQDGIKEVC